MKVFLAQFPVWPYDSPPLGPASVKAWLKYLGHEVKAHDFNAGLGARNPVTRKAAAVLSAHSRLCLDFLRKLADGAPVESCWEVLSDLPGAGELLQFSRACAHELLLEGADAIGFSVQWGSLALSLACARVIRERDEEVKLVFGGPECGYHPAFMRSLTDRNIIDSVVVGEGEEPVLFLFGGPGSTGALFQSGFETGLVSFRDFPAPDINRLPAPDFSDFDLRLYSEPFLPVLSSRGCVGACAFCRERELWRKFRQREPESVALGLRELADATGYRMFRFNDSLINGDMDWLREFCGCVIDKELNVQWFGNVRPHPGLTPEFLARMKSAGCVELMFGIESASEKILKRLGKGTDPRTISANLADAARCGLRTHTYWMFGCPGETADDAGRSLRFLGAESRSINSMYFHRYFPTPRDLSSDASGDQFLLRLNLPLFRPLFLAVQTLLSSERNWAEAGSKKLPEDISLIAESLQREHRKRVTAWALVAVIGQALHGLEQTGWRIVRPRPSFLELKGLAGSRVMVLLPKADDGTEIFIRGLLEMKPEIVRLFWMADGTRGALENLERLGALCGGAGIKWETALKPILCRRKTAPDSASAPCEVCPALERASSRELEICASAVLDELSAGAWDFERIWDQRELVFRRFMASFCGARCSRLCEGCEIEAQTCPFNCCGETPALSEIETTDDGWY